MGRRLVKVKIFLVHQFDDKNNTYVDIALIPYLWGVFVIS